MKIKGNLGEEIEKIKNLLSNRKYDEVIDATKPIKEKKDYTSNKEGYFIEYALGKALYERKKVLPLEEINEVINLFNESVKLNPDFTHGYFSLGYAYMDKGVITGSVKDVESAAENFEKVVKTRPELAGGYNPAINHLKEMCSKFQKKKEILGLQKLENLLDTSTKN